jgi:hypothetical protein
VSKVLTRTEWRSSEGRDGATLPIVPDQRLPGDAGAAEQPRIRS